MSIRWKRSFSLSVLVGEVFGVFEIDKAISAQQGSDLEIAGHVFDAADLVDLVAGELDDMELVEDFDRLGEVFVGSFDPKNRSRGMEPG